MRKIDSLRLFEKVIYNESLVAQKEKLFLTNGRLFTETGTNGNYDGVNVNFKKEDEFLKRYPGVFIYSYHTHIKNAHLNDLPTPPSFDDFCAERRLRERAIKKGKELFQGL